MTLTLIQGGATAAPAAACVRCSRSEADHDLCSSGQADDVRRRIWRALGQPCASFAEEHAVIFAENQAASSRWARPDRGRPAVFNARTAAASTRGAARARALMLERQQASQGRNTHGK